jgi:hypothetical protein
MFFFDGNVPLDAMRDVTQSGRHITVFFQTVDLWPKLIAACVSSVAGFGITRVFSRFQDIDRRSERVRLVSEVSYILQLRQHLQTFCCEGATWEIVERLKPQIDDFAEINLRRIEQALRIESGESAPAHSRSVLLRILPFYPPARPWLWIHHTLFFVALGTLFFPIMGAYSASRSGNGFSLGGFGHALISRWANILGVLLATAFFAWLAYVNESKLDSPSAPEDDNGKLTRSFRERFFLCFAPRGKGMWAAYIAYLAYLGTLIRFTPEMLAQGDFTSGVTYILIAMLCILFFVPGAAFNLAANYYDMKLASPARIEAPAAPATRPRRIFKALRHSLLFERPENRWIWLLNAASYLLLLVTLPTTLMQIFFCIMTSAPWLTLILTPIQVLPLVLLNLMVNFTNGILHLQHRSVPAEAAQPA